jgi:hypothetical protein
LPIRFSAEIIIDAHLKCDFNIDTIHSLIARDFASQLSIHLSGRPSCFNPRDREICVDPPLVDESYSNLAGQAGVDSQDERPATLTTALEANYLYTSMLLCDLDKAIKVTLRTAIEINIMEGIVVNPAQEFDVNVKDEIALNILDGNK